MPCCCARCQSVDPENTCTSAATWLYCACEVGWWCGFCGAFSMICQSSSHHLYNEWTAWVELWRYGLARRSVAAQWWICTHRLVVTISNSHSSEPNSWEKLFLHVSPQMRGANAPFGRRRLSQGTDKLCIGIPVDLCQAGRAHI